LAKIIARERACASAIHLVSNTQCVSRSNSPAYFDSVAGLESGSD
jgi:hypothetical protein